MTVSRNKRLAEQALKHAGENVEHKAARTAVLVGIGYALLEAAFQVGRVADSQPVFGPPEER
jgi:hypothetical protein